MLLRILQEFFKTIINVCELRGSEEVVKEVKSSEPEFNRIY